MTDTLPEIAELVRQKLMARCDEERFMMGIRSFDGAPDMVIASMPKGLPREEFRRQLFQRIYGKARTILTIPLKRHLETGISTVAPRTCSPLTKR